MYFPIFRANVAVMSILRSAHLPAQQRIEMRDLRARWTPYGLRSRDLERSVARLESLGFIDVDRARGHQYLMLTEMGYRSAHSMIGLIEYLAVVPRRIRHVLQRSKLWNSPRGRCRRKGDRGNRAAALRSVVATRAGRDRLT